MKLGGNVPGIFTDAWLFVEGDVNRISQRVKEYDRNAALVYNAADHHLGIAIKHWFPETGEVWIIAFRLRDPENEQEFWYGEPNADVLRQLREADYHKIPVAERKRKTLKLMDLRDRRIAMEQADRARSEAEDFIYKYRKAKGIKHRIFVPGE